MTLRADLKGKRALITGASSGFGAHFAEVLARAGATVILAARRLALLEELVARIHVNGGTARAIPIDVADAVSVSGAISAAGELDIVVNNAGITVRKPALEQSEDDWDRVMDTNLKGMWLVATESARSMRAARHYGSIINIASILGLRQMGRVTPYAVSKAAVIHLTKQLALELARYDIRVNAIAPGYFATDLNRDFFSSALGKDLITCVPQRRLGVPDDLDGALLLLASEASRFMTGCIIPVDGGHLVSQL